MMRRISIQMRGLAKTLLLLSLIAGLAGCDGADVPRGRSATAPSSGNEVSRPVEDPAPIEGATVFDITAVPEYAGSPFVEVSGNVPAFTNEDISSPVETYAPLDSLGRCGGAMAIVSRETMPTEERGSVGMVEPSGWHTVRYDDLISDRYLYNRCHLIGYQLTAENANELNLITGTRYLNVEGMLPFENEVADYVEASGNRVLYRVTPVFVGDELVARGVHMEARSVEDDGAGVQFNVFCYNVQPGVVIDYASGESRRSEETVAPTSDGSVALLEGGMPAERGDASGAEPQIAYVLNINTRKFHKPGCRSVAQMRDENKSEVTATRGELVAQGYEPCANCIDQAPGFP